MSEAVIRILGIAPYDSMKNAMLRAAEKYPQIHLDVYIGNLERGAEIVRRHEREHYNVILSRGGTVNYIRRVTDLPIVEISLSSYDILRTMKLIDNYPSRYAIVGFPNITVNTQLIGNILQYNIETVTIHDSSEVEPVLKSLMEQGISMVLGDMITTQCAKRLGMNVVLLTSGDESIHNALQQAVTLYSTYSVIREKNFLYESAMRSMQEHTIIFDENHKVVFSSHDHSSSEELTQFLRQSIPNVLPNKDFKAFHLVGQTMYSVNGKLYNSGTGNFYIFHAEQSKVPMISSKYGIQFTDRSDAQQQYFKSFYGISGSINLSHVNDELEQVGSSNFPVMIYGEEGTGKEQIARLLYIKSDRSRNPMVIINCGLLNEKSWEFLTNHYNSPFNDSGNTIYIENPDVLTGEQGQQLLSIIIDTRLTERNRLLFSCTDTSLGTRNSIIHEISDTLSCVNITLPPLRQQLDKLEALCSLYLASLNLEIGRQIVGFNSNAIDLMLQYDWPGNFTQLRRVINELCITTNSSYINAVSVRKAIDQERQLWAAREESRKSSSDSVRSVDLNRTLDQITKDIIKTVLDRNDGNQSAAARQLGISRTTMWRYLSRDN